MTTYSHVNNICNTPHRGHIGIHQLGEGVWPYIYVQKIETSHASTVMQDPSPLRLDPLHEKAPLATGRLCLLDAGPAAREAGRRGCVHVRWERQGGGVLVGGKGFQVTYRHVLPHELRVGNCACLNLGLNATVFSHLIK